MLTLTDIAKCKLLRCNL